MTPPTSPYAKDLGDREPIASLDESMGRIRGLAGGWTQDTFAKSYAPGKWTGAQLLLHLVHVEMIFGARIRFGLSVPEYTVQPMDQDALMQVEPAPDGRVAFEAFLALRQINLALFRSLTPDSLTRAFTHPEFGSINAGWTITVLAGHDWHHLRQLEIIARA